MKTPFSPKIQSLKYTHFNNGIKELLFGLFSI